MRIIDKDFLAGMFFMACGIFFLLVAQRTLPMGTAFRMGPGYVPVILSAALLLLGGIILARSFTAPAAPGSAMPVRALLLIGAAPIVFGATVQGLGLILATAIAVFLSTLAGKRSSFRSALVTTTAITAFCVILFHYALGFPIALFGSLLTGIGS